VAHHAACLEVCTISIEVFGIVESTGKDFESLLSTLSHSVFKTIQTDLEGSPEMLSAYFDLLSRTMLFCPRTFLHQASVFSVVCELSCHVLKLRHRDVLRSLLAFLASLTGPKAMGLKGSDVSNVVLQQMTVSGRALLHATLISTSDSCPVDLAPKLAETVLMLVQVVPREESVQLAIQLLTMPHLQKGQFESDSDRERFVKLLVSPDLWATPRRFRAMWGDFAKVCQGQGQADALVAYEM